MDSFTSKRRRCNQNSEKDEMEINWSHSYGRENKRRWRRPNKRFCNEVKLHGWR